MKNYHFTSGIAFTLFKWIALDITFFPKSNDVFQLSITYNRNCSLPGIYFTLGLFRLFNLWFSIYDQRVLDSKTKKLVLSVPQVSQPLTAKEIKDADGLLGDLIYWSPRFDQMFHRYEHLPSEVFVYKKEFSYLSNDMERYLRSAVTEKR